MATEQLARPRVRACDPGREDDEAANGRGGSQLGGPPFAGKRTSQFIFKAALSNLTLSFFVVETSRYTGQRGQSVRVTVKEPTTGAQARLKGPSAPAEGRI